MHSSPNIIKVFKSRRMRWAGHVAGMGDRMGAYRVLVGRLKDGVHLEVPGLDGRKILN
jgi:hypothetical protein